MGIVRICGPKDKPKDKEANIINCCSISKNWSKGLSPFYCGPCEINKGEFSKNVENGWQYSKVYNCHVDEENNPTKDYFSWRKMGFEKQKADRYPMGKGAIPLYLFYEEKKLGYIEARKELYIPIYGKSVVKTESFKILQKEFKKLGKEEIIWLWDFDGYDHKALNMTYKEVVNNPNKKCGHAFVLGYLLENI